MKRHWMEIMQLTGHVFPVDTDHFSLEMVLDANLLEYKEDIEAIADSADKQLQIETKLVGYFFFFNFSFFPSFFFFFLERGKKRKEKIKFMETDFVPC